jgi:hypothetical protein
VGASRSSRSATAAAPRRPTRPTRTDVALSVLDPERRSALLAAKLGALARDNLHVTGTDVTTFPGGAALLSGTTGVVLVDERPERGLGPALAWSERRAVEALHVVVDDAAGRLARQAEWFEAPPAVWWARGRELHRVDPEPHVPAPVPPPEALALAEDIAAAGATVIVEHGAVTGEVLGLEVARVTGSGSTVALEVGIGRHDREAFAIIHGDRPTGEALAGVVEAVRRDRRADHPASPLHRIAPERWLREIVLARPDLVGATLLERNPGPLDRPNVKDPWPAVLSGVDTGGGEVVVVCSVGVDLDLVPYASDARATDAPDARLVLVLPERDAVDITRRLAGRLREPAEIVTVGDGWRAIA